MRSRDFGSRVFTLITRVRHDFGQAEIEHLGVASLGNKDVRGLDVAVKDALGVGSIQRIGNLDGQRQNQLGFKGTAGNAVLQGEAVQKLHGDERLSIVLGDFVDGADVGMVEGGGCLCFTLEAGQGLGISGQFIGKKLQRYETMQREVFRLVDDAHPAAAEFLHDSVVRDGLTDHRRKSYWPETCESMEALGWWAAKQVSCRNIPTSLKSLLCANRGTGNSSCLQSLSLDLSRRDRED